MAKNKQVPGATTKMTPSKSTIIWGKDEEAGDYIKVPCAILSLARYSGRPKGDVQPRHILLLVLASRKFEEKPIRVYWEDLAEDFGVGRDTVRKWGYELKKKGLVRIKQNRGRDPERNKVGHRNERNTFDISPFVELVSKAHAKRRKRKRKETNKT